MKSQSCGCKQSVWWVSLSHIKVFQTKGGLISVENADRAVGRDSALIDSRLLCRQPPGRRLSPVTGRSPTLYIRDCCWQGCSEQPDLDGHIPYRRGISFPPLCPAASPPTGWLWTDRRASAKEKHKQVSHIHWPRRNVGHCSTFGFMQHSHKLQTLLSSFHRKTQQPLFGMLLFPLSLVKLINSIKSYPYHLWNPTKQGLKKV